MRFKTLPRFSLRWPLPAETRVYARAPREEAIRPLKPPARPGITCEAFAKVSDHVAQLRDRAAEEGKVVAISERA